MALDQVSSPSCYFPLLRAGGRQISKPGGNGMAGEVLLPPVPLVAWLGLNDLDLGQHFLLFLSHVSAQVLPVNIVFPLPNRGPSSLSGRICQGVRPVVPNA
eukprot:11833545-Heterocapsa_arctica.AAC.1